MGFIGHRLRPFNYLEIHLEIKVTRVGAHAQNVGRPTALGNPFYMRDESMRDEVCDKYEVWFKAKTEAKDPAVMAQLRSLWSIGKRDGHVNLGCYCAPRRCHADTIARFLRNYAA